MNLSADGFVVFPRDEKLEAWAREAYSAALNVLSDPDMQKAWLRHGGTWFVGVDALPNSPDGSIGGMALRGAWQDLVAPPTHWHQAQLSVTYRGYPAQDQDESDAAHRYRVKRCGAHVDGLLLEDGRRYPREPHRFVLGLPLNDSDACPLVVWCGSHRPMRAALKAHIGDRDPRDVDVTEVYKATRATLFETCTPVEVTAKPGQAILLDRHVLHGIKPWEDNQTMPPEGRMVAYFRPLCDDASDWLAD